MLKQDAHIFSGMQRDMSISKQKPEFLWDAHNIRLTAREGDTLLSITNEKGTENIEFTTKDNNKSPYMKGTYLGHCVINNYLVVFTRDSLSNTDYIYRINKEDNYHIDILYEGSDSASLGFDTNCPIETLGIYENKKIQKVYWVDGINQPREINIVKETLDNSTVDEVRAKYSNISHPFDFIRSQSLNSTISVRRESSSGGLLESGVIQYALTYYDKYGQETNISYVTPIFYIAFNNRGGSPEEKVGIAFKVTISHLDRNFDYARVYSIFRSSINATPTVKRLIDIPTGKYSNSGSNSLLYYRTKDTILINGVYISAYTGNIESYEEGRMSARKAGYYHFVSTQDSPIVITLPVEGRTITFNNNSSDVWISPTNTDGPGAVSEGRIIHANGEPIKITDGSLRLEEIDGATFIDNGTIGDIVDPTSLLYIGGEKITASTITQKDGTLFLGDLRITRPSIELFADSLSKNAVHSGSSRTLKLDTGGASSLYTYKSLMVATNTNDYLTNPAGFKYGEWYRLGIQFQHETGKWSDPIWVGDYQTFGTGFSRPSLNGNKITIPTHRISLNLSGVPNEYKKVRGVVVFPTLQDRTILAQGILCPTVYNLSDRGNGIPYAQSSWFFRPTPPANSDSTNNGNLALSGSVVEWRHNNILFSHGDRGAEIQGIPEFRTSTSYLGSMSASDNMSFVMADGSTSTFNKKDCTSLFAVDRSILTMHSPDIEFDDSFNSLDFGGLKVSTVGNVNFTSCMGDINIQTSSPVIHSDGAGFIHRSVSNTYGYRGLVAGLFYADYLVDDTASALRAYDREHFDYMFMVYPWQKSGSLNNDIVRPANSGSRSSVLLKKKISNLRFADSVTWKDSSNLATNSIQLFSSDQVTMLRLSGTKSYYGNVDTMLAPIKEFSVVFSNGDYHSLHPGLDDTNSSGISKARPAFTDNKNTFLCFTKDGADEGRAWHRNGNVSNKDTNYSAVENSSHIGDASGALAASKEAIRMKYKSGRHLVVELNYSPLPVGDSGLYMAELTRDYSVGTMFGGTGKDALFGNVWVPAGEPVSIVRTTNTNTDIDYIYGDTWYQRYDCLKTYPFTLEDENSITEIGSFLCETRVNIDGRYDKNRGQASNLVTTPNNFNLLNPVYSQLNNFFTYRILDSDYYKLSEYQSSITWSKEKNPAAIVDTWANITLANVLDLDGNMGPVTSLVTINDNIYCFQENGISQIMFNSRVQIPTSDGLPVEISNNYKVDGSRYITDSMGVKNKWAIHKSPSGLYFIDSTSHNLYNLGQGLTNVSNAHGFSYWFDTQDVDTPWIPASYSTKLFYDKNNNDLYITTANTSLAFSETLGQFTSFMSYENTPAMFNIGADFYSIRNESIDDGKTVQPICVLHSMFTGEHNHFFGHYKPFDITFISNADSALDKTFTNLELRADFWENNTLQHNRLFDYIQAWNEYQDSGECLLTYANAKPSNLKKKFRIWRIDIPRDKDRKLDRIRNTWTKIKLGMYGDEDHSNTMSMVLHDLNVQYHI